MATREYLFINGPETSTLPTVTDPTVDGDFVTLAYANKTYTRGVADLVALKALGTTARTDKQSVYVESLRMFFAFDSGSALTGDDINVVTPDAGTGRWLRIQPSYTRFVNDAAFETWKGSVGSVGDIYYNTTLNNFKFHTGSAWVTIPILEESMSITGDLTVSGDLTVNGTTTTISTTNLDVEDTNITINDGGNDASSEGAGLRVERTGTHGSFIYANAAASKFKIGDLGSEVEVVTLTHTQTLTGKTLALASNSITGTANHVAIMSAGGLLTTEALLNTSRGGTGASTFNLGSVVYAGPSGVYTQDTNNFFWNTTFQLLGLGNQSPECRLHVLSTNSAFPAIGARYSSTGARMSINLANSSFYPYLAVNANQAAGTDDSTFELAASTRAARLRMDGGIFQFDRSSAAGTAGNTITWSNSMYIDAAGNVGIGASPSHKLTVVDGITTISRNASDANLRIQRSNGTFGSPTDVTASQNLGLIDFYGYKNGAYRNSAQILVTADGTPGASAVAGAMAFFTDNNSGTPSERMRIDKDGNVGINTSSPGSKMHVSEGDIRLSSASVAKFVGFYQSATQDWVIQHNTDRSLKIDSPGQRILALNETGGSVGIGTISPETRLVVKGTGSIQYRHGTSNNIMAQLGERGGGVDGGFLALLSVGVSKIELDSDGTVAFKQTSNGVVIGTPTGGDKGAGTLNAQAVYDDNTLLTDYVFEAAYLGKPIDIKHSDYRMKSLKEEIEHTRQNLHLSTIIGRKEWEANGSASVGKLVSQLWETIETQFLYIKELNERLEKLEA